jgi:type I restriction enzyme M protein
VPVVRDESLEDLGNLPAPEVIARAIVGDLTAAPIALEVAVAALEAAGQVDRPVRRGRRGRLSLVH